MPSIKAIMDTSFLIDWVRYDKRDLIFEYYDIIYLPESVLNEIRTEQPLIWLSNWLAKGKIKILEETLEVRREAIKLVETSRVLPVRSCDYPEAICIILAREYSLQVLTENGGVFALKELIPDYSYVEALRGIDLLFKLYKAGLIKDFIEELKKYINATKHMYSRRVLEKYGIREI